MQETDVSIYLARCYKVLEGMDSQAEDVIIVAHVESLGILLSVVHNPNGSHVVDYLPGLSVEQVAPAIVAPVAATKHSIGLWYERLSGGKRATARTAVRILLCFTVVLPMNEVQPQAAPRCSLALLHGRCTILFLALFFELRQVFFIDLRLI